MQKIEAKTINQEEYFSHKIINSGFFIALLLALMIFSLPAYGENSDEANRFSMSTTDDGFVRLDRVSGEITFCQKIDNNLVCKLAADEREALNSKIASLENKITVLQQNMSRNGVGDENLGPAHEKSWDETEAEMEKALSFGERMIRRFFWLFKDLESEEKGEAERKT